MGKGFWTPPNDHQDNITNPGPGDNNHRKPEHSIWCPKCEKETQSGERRERIEKNGFYHCGRCDTRLVNIAKDGCCPACGKYARGKFHCENCMQWVCGRHIEKRNVYGFAIWGCPTCFGISMPREKYMKDEEKGDYTGFRFVWNKELGWYEWDGDLSLCYYDRVIAPMRQKEAEKLKTTLERYEKENGKGNYEEFDYFFGQGKSYDLNAVRKYIKDFGDLT